MALMFLSGGGAASADSIVITYRSGRVQTVKLDEGIKDIQEIGYRRAVAEKPDAGERDMPSSQTDSGNHPLKEQPPAVKKQGIKFKWAAPLEDTE